MAFSGAMFGLVISDNLLVLYIFWELTTVLSFLLVGHYAERLASRRAAVQALLVTTAGGLAMLVGVIVLGHVPPLCPYTFGCPEPWRPLLRSAPTCTPLPW
ncbi:Putative cation antiporter NADH dehydrogenase subunit [Mycobacteroides abscessus subsp. abscessus]|nr:Putative cation antiporter NADH dehydrogenase subunit [Mycobacteroides abscessus subsp. abscessus]